MEPTLDDFKRWLERELPLAKTACYSQDFNSRKEADYLYDAILGAQRALHEFEKKERVPP